MSISTKDCKDFILKISEFIGVSQDDVWKRTKKYKEGDMVLRDFESQQGKTLTICEYEGELTLYALNSSVYDEEEIVQEFTEPGMKYMGKSVSVAEAATFLAECAIQSPFIDDPHAYQAAKRAENWTLIHASNSQNFDQVSYELEYKDEEGYSVSIDEKEVAKIFWFVLDPMMYDTAYRYYVFETKGDIYVLAPMIQIDNSLILL